MNTCLHRLAVALGALCFVMSSPAFASALDNTAWVLSSLAGQALLPKATPTARFEGGRVSGTDGCNRYSATYTATDTALEIGARGPSTMMACPPAVMRQAEAFMAALTGASSFRIEGDVLTLLAASGATLATFAAQASSLAGTSWEVTGYNNGKQAVVSLLKGTTVTMTFAADGKVTGSAGCNRFFATYQLDRGKLSFGPPGTTRKHCEKPDGVMTQEQRFLAALATAATTQFEGERLHLRTKDDALAMTLRKKAP
jgi:heat shock protein HslJ